MPQQRMPSGPKTPTWPTRTTAVDVNCNEPKPSPPTSNFEESFMMLASQECRQSSTCCLNSCGVEADLGGNAASVEQGFIKLTCCNENCINTGWMHRACWKHFEEVTHKVVPNGKSNKNRAWGDKQKVQKINGRKCSWECHSCSKNVADKSQESMVVVVPATTVPTAPVKFSGIGSGKKMKAKKQGSVGSNTSNSSTSTSSSSSSSAVRLSASFQHQLSFDGAVRNHHSGHLRSRTLSLCSAGSSPPSCSDDISSCLSGSQPKFEFFADATQAAVGNIFGRRSTLDAFNCLPQYQQNPYQIKVEDEGPHGNDEIRGFILTTLSGHKVTRFACSTCGTKMPIYDKYPLIDGTFFLSPLCYNKSDGFIAPVVEKGSRRLHLNAVCVECLSADLSNDPAVKSKCLRCSFCEKIWSGSRFLMGSMYSYDIFSAVPCCQARLLCKSCELPVAAYDGGPASGLGGVPGYSNGNVFVNFVGFPKTNGLAPNGFSTPGSNGCGKSNVSLKFFSDYSKKFCCPHCGTQDFHFVRPLNQVYIRGRRPF